LRRLAPNATAAAAVDALLAQARRQEVRVPNFGDWRGTRDFTTGHYVSAKSTANVEELSRLRRLFAPRPGSRADELLRGLEAIEQIYSYNSRAGECAQRRAARLSQQRNSRTADEDQLLPITPGGTLDRRLRVLVKAGSNHLVPGNFTNVHSLGNMLHEFATTNQMHALTVVMLPVREEWPSFDRVPPEVQVLLPSKALGATSWWTCVRSALTCTPARRSASPRGPAGLAVPGIRNGLRFVPAIQKRQFQSHRAGCRRPRRQIGSSGSRGLGALASHMRGRLRTAALQTR
jgi:hypothetical protein